MIIFFFKIFVDFIFMWMWTEINHNLNFRKIKKQVSIVLNTAYLLASSTNLPSKERKLILLSFFLPPKLQRLMSWFSGVLSFFLDPNFKKLNFDDAEISEYNLVKKFKE